MGCDLSPLQRRILKVLAGEEPPWSLTGGGALAGFHLHHRETRDLDLFWHAARELPEVGQLTRRMEDAGLVVRTLRTMPGFAQLRVSDGHEATIVDLVADPVPVVEQPEEHLVDGTAILVDTPHEVMVNKLCALLSRSEYRDLVDLEALLEAGQVLGTALRHAALKDGGFSSTALAWVLSDMPVRALGLAAGASEAEIARRVSFRDRLTMALVDLSRPPQTPK